MIKKQLLFLLTSILSSISLVGMEQDQPSDLLADSFIKECQESLNFLTEENFNPNSENVQTLIHKVSKVYNLLNNQEIEKIIPKKELDLSQVSSLKFSNNFSLENLKTFVHESMHTIVLINSTIESKKDVIRTEYFEKNRNLELAAQKIAQARNENNNQYRDNTNSLIKCKAELFHTLK